MPYVTSTIAIGIVFRYFFNGDYGIVNYVLGFFGIPSVNWLDNVQMSMPTLIIFGVWTSLAFNIIILLAGLRNIDEEHFKIAKCLAPQTAKFSDVLLVVHCLFINGQLNWRL